MKERLLTLLGPVLSAALFALALWVLHRELGGSDLAGVLEPLRSIAASRVALALGLAALGYAALTACEALAFRFIRRPLGYPRIAVAGFIAYAFSNNLGISFFGGGAVRYRLYLSWGVPGGEIAQVIAFGAVTLWVGWIATAGAVLALDPLPMQAWAWAPLASSRPLGVLLLGLLGLWTAASALRLRVPLTEIALPRPPLLGAQLLVSAADWTLSSAVLYTLLPPAAVLPFGRLLGAYLLAVVVGLASQVPAGLGVFEATLIVLLGGSVPQDALLGSLLAYRVIYYLIPLAAAFLLFAGFETAQRRALLMRARLRLGRWLPAVVPRLFAFTTLAAGTMLLFSGATPPAAGRVEWLLRLLPLPVLEISHLLGSAIGVSLLFLARALLQRIDAAYALTLAMLAAGIAASLLKGLDYEEAAILCAMLAALLPCRSFFDRRSSLLAQPLSPGWTLGVLGVLGATVFVTLLAYASVEYSSELWWQFEGSAAASRSLRALLGGFALVGCYGLMQLLRPAPAKVELPSARDLDRVRPVVAAARRTGAHLALLGDKQLLVHERGNAFVMYGVERNSWIAMGDPVGPAPERQELAWRFRELADLHRGRTVFYEVGTEDLPLYVDLGLSLHKLGEEARVPLDGFSLAGGSRKSLRQPHHRMLREGCSFEIVPPAGVGPLLDAVESISDAWLADKKTREKRFSLGFFKRDYLERLPLALVRQEQRIVAFANVWMSAEREELSVDLMRRAPDAPSGVMEYLLAELMLWGSAQGYGWFNLGMAPFAGLAGHRLSPLWHRFGAFLFRYGEDFYGFQGLREFKEKFHPVWEPRFLASPGGLAVPVVLTHVAALISGGVAGTVAK